MFKAIKYNRKGFSLIEVITILFVISLGLVGVLTLIVQNIQGQQFNKQNIIAHQLAQEGIELIRKVRDSNWLTGANWNENLAAGDYYMDYNDSIPTATSSAEVLYLDANNFYTHDSGDAVSTSIFSRQISLAVNSTSSIQVISQVDWGDKNKTFTYTLETLLYDWR